MNQQHRLSQEDVVYSFFLIGIVLVMLALVVEGVMSFTNDGTLKNKWTLILFCPTWLIIYVVTLNNMAKD